MHCIIQKITAITSQQIVNKYINLHSKLKCSVQFIKSLTLFYYEPYDFLTNYSTTINMIQWMINRWSNTFLLNIIQPRYSRCEIFHPICLSNRFQLSNAISFHKSAYGRIRIPYSNINFGKEIEWKIKWKFDPQCKFDELKNLIEMYNFCVFVAITNNFNNFQTDQSTFNDFTIGYKLKFIMHGIHENKYDIYNIPYQKLCFPESETALNQEIINQEQFVGMNEDMDVNELPYYFEPNNHKLMKEIKEGTIIFKIKMISFDNIKIMCTVEVPSCKLFEAYYQMDWFHPYDKKKRYHHFDEDDFVSLIVCIPPGLQTSIISCKLNENVHYTINK